jgi:hypothetical protein
MITHLSPTDADANFSLEFRAKDTIVTPGSTVSSTVDDRNITTYSETTVDRAGVLYATEIVPGTFTPYLNYVCLDESVAEVDAFGVVTRLTNGTARILAKTLHKTLPYDVPVSRIGGTTTVVLDSYVANSMARNCSDAVDTRIAGKTAATAKPMFNTFNHAAASYVRNTNCWAADLDLTCISAWNSTSGVSSGLTAISPLHGVTARHIESAFPNGTVLRFVTADGTVVPRTVTGRSSLGSGDLTVVRWNTALPNTIGFAKVLPDNVMDYLPSLSAQYPIPALFVDQERKALVFEVHALLGGTPASYYPSTAARQAFYEPLISGDSGFGRFLIISNELVLTNISDYQDEVNAAMTALGGGYQLTTVSLSPYTDFS